MSEIFSTVLFILFFGFFIYLGLRIFVWLFTTVSDMAHSRAQSRRLWVVLSLFWNPFTSIFLLWLFFPPTLQR